MIRGGRGNAIRRTAKCVKHFFYLHFKSGRGHSKYLFGLLLVSGFLLIVNPQDVSGQFPNFGEGFKIPKIPNLFTNKIFKPEPQQVQWDPTNAVMPSLAGDLERDRKAMAEAPDKDRVLWQYRIALSQLRKGNFGVAAELLDDALLRVQASYGRSSKAGSARNVLKKESVKPFIGEPYERSMANYLRAIIYWKSNNLESARAAFKQAQFEDSDPEKRKYQSDYVTFDYLYGLASHKLKDPIWEEWYKNSLTHTNDQESFTPPPTYDDRANLILFIEFGVGPTKYAAGKHHRELHFTGGSTDVKRVRVTCGTITQETGPYDNLTFQAITRGGRVMDHILKAKSNFKSASGTVGTIALLGSVGAVAAGADERVAYGLLALGFASKWFSHLAKPDADTRCWNNLPQCLSFVAMPAKVGIHTLNVDLLGENGQPLTGRTRKVAFEVKDVLQDTVLFVSELDN